MKVTSLNILLTASALGLLVANWQVRRPQAGVNPQPSQPALGSMNQATGMEASERPEAGSLKSLAARPLPQNPSAQSNSPAGQPHSGLEWAKIETSDYKQYVRNLRAM